MPKNPLVRQWVASDDSESGLIVWCPGCEEPHQVRTKGGTFQWGWDGVLNPLTIEGSILTKGGRNGSDHACHSFIRGSQWQFLTDSTHTLAGQTVPLAPFPDYWNREG